MYDKCYEDKIRAQEIALGLPADGSANHGVSRTRRRHEEGKVLFTEVWDPETGEVKIILAKNGEEPK